MTSSNEEEYNAFDELGGQATPEEIQKQNAEMQAKNQKLDYLIHKVFAQTEEGKELLELWKDALIFSPGAEPGIDSIDVGMREGTKRFIRNIILTIKKVEQ